MPVSSHRVQALFDLAWNYRGTRLRTLGDLIPVSKALGQAASIGLWALQKDRDALAPRRYRSGITLHHESTEWPTVFNMPSNAMTTAVPAISRVILRSGGVNAQADPRLVREKKWQNT